LSISHAVYWYIELQGEQGETGFKGDKGEAGLPGKNVSCLPILFSRFYTIAVVTRHVIQLLKVVYSIVQEILS